MQKGLVYYADVGGEVFGSMVSLRDAIEDKTDEVDSGDPAELSRAMVKLFPGSR